MQLAPHHVILGVACGLAAGIGSMSLVYAQQSQTLERPFETPGVEQTIILNAPLREFPGKRALMFIGEFEPGASTPIHRHFGTEFLFVLEGEGVVEQPGRETKKLLPGSVTLFESPAGKNTFIHQAKNVNSTKRLKTLVLIIHSEGDPPALPLKS